MKLRGKRTYLTICAGIILTGLKGTGLISVEMYSSIVSILGFLGLGFLRASKK